MNSRAIPYSIRQLLVLLSTNPYILTWRIYLLVTPTFLTSPSLCSNSTCPTHVPLIGELVYTDHVGIQVSCSAEGRSAVRDGRYPVSKYSRTSLYIAGHFPHLDTWRKKQPSHHIHHTFQHSPLLVTFIPTDPAIINASSSDPLSLIFTGIEVNPSGTSVESTWW